MLWQDWVEAVAAAIEMTTDQAAIFLSLFLTIVLVMCVLIITKGKRVQTVLPATCLLAFVFWIFMGWFPAWSGSVIAVVFALMLARDYSGG